ncbi:unnamed protein product [Owenia fusiformis]|uniref:Uncharacterized protein n=1 Tax=Owenia fusiformis TaxID=6347 RepID=A0A8J1UT92_OWEFU|nr:unnamed protein product [Owenia fusiformis]
MKDITSLDIVVNLLKCLFTFYCIYYIAGSICFGAFRLEIFDGKIPFDFKSWIDFTLCCTSYSSQQLANLISMFSAYFFSTLFYVVFLPSRLWDYAITVTFFHIIASCLVMLSFPLSWSWWLCLGTCLLMMIAIGQMVLYCCRSDEYKDS